MSKESKNQSEEEEKESNLSAFDQHVLFLEAQLTEARFKAAQSIEILEDCNQVYKTSLNSFFLLIGLTAYFTTIVRVAYWLLFLFLALFFEIKNTLIQNAN